MPKTLAIIPACGGSNGIPRNILRPLAGRPMIAHTIQAAMAAGRVDRVVVSTDEVEIADVSRQLGAEVVLWPSEIAGDVTRSEAALLEVLAELERREQYRPELTVLLPCTSPLTAADDIDGTLAALDDQQADTAVAVVDFHSLVWRRQADGDAVGVNHDKRVLHRREPQYLEAGGVYAMRTAGFREAGHRCFGKTALYLMPAERRCVIDGPADLAVAEMRLRQQATNTMADRLPRKLEAVVFDFDGVFTDNRVLLDEDGREAATCSRGDGMGIGLLKQTGLPLLVLSKEPVPIVVRRCQKLGLECLHGVDDKLPLLEQWLAERNLSLAGTVYVGNDVNDRECLEAVGCGVVPADAHAAVVPLASIVLDFPGGHGAVRQLCDLVLEHLANAPQAND